MINKIKENVMFTKDGLKEVVDFKPEYDPETQFLHVDGFEIKDDKVYKVYEVVDIEKITPANNEVDELRQEIKELKKLIERGFSK